jgi:O-antigen/teichoic acid export membrane protein
VVVLVVSSTVPVCTSFVHSRLILAEGRSATVALVTVAAALINIGLNLALVPHLGINGSALATLITYALLAAGMATASRRLLALKRPPVGLWAELIGAIAIVLATRYLPTHGFWLVVRIGGATVCAVWAVTTLRQLQSSGADLSR